MLLDDSDEIPTRQVKARVGTVNVSANISDEQVKYLERVDTAQFLPCTPAVKTEICSRVSAGELVTDLCTHYVGALKFPPYEVIRMWEDEDGDFSAQLANSRKQAARLRFEQALKIAHEYRDDPKALKTYVDILKRHAEVDDAEVFQVKGESGSQQVIPHITIVTGVPQREEKVVEVEAEQIEDAS